MWANPNHGDLGPAFCHSGGTLPGYPFTNTVVKHHISSGSLSKTENYSDFFFWIDFLTEPIHHLPGTREKEQECTAGGGGGICHTTDLDQLKMLLNRTLEDDSQPSFSV